MVGTPVIIIGDEKISKSNMIWFGNCNAHNEVIYDGPVLWRVLGNGNTDSGKLLLDGSLWVVLTGMNGPGSGTLIRVPGVTISLPERLPVSNRVPLLKHPRMMLPVKVGIPWAVLIE